MRWEERLLDVFDDLEQQAEGLALAERDAEVAELSRAEYAHVDFASRLHASTGHEVTLVVAGMGHIEARIIRVGLDWMLADDGQHEWILRTAALAHVRGLSELAVGEQNRSVSARVGVGSALRAVAESRAAVVLHRLDGGLVRGQLRRVGADFVELWVSEHAEAWTPGQEGHVEVVPFAGLAAVRAT
jgi:hypothetical protein